MASASELKGRRIPSFPGAKSNETVTFVGDDGNTIEVVKNISPGALKLLKKRGFKKQSTVLREQEEAALKKANDGKDDEDDEDDEDEDEDESPALTSTPDKPAPVKKVAQKAANK